MTVQRTAADLPPEPELDDLLRHLLRQLRLELRTHVPAKVMAWDPATNTVAVEIGTLPVVAVRDATQMPRAVVAVKGVPPDMEATLAPIVLTEIPVYQPRGSLGGVTIPLAPGDTGDLHVHDRSIEMWRLAGKAADPVLAFTHSLKDGVFYPGHRPKPLTQPVDPTATVVTGPIVKLGSAAISPAVKGAELVALISSAIAAGVAAATAIDPAGEGTIGLMAMQTAWLAGVPTTLSLRVLVE